MDFKINNQKNVIILTGPKKEKLFTGERTFYKDLLRSIQKRGGQGFILPFWKNKSSTDAYSWNEQDNKWIRSLCPTPTSVYNRYPYRDVETEPTFQDFLRSLEKRDIPYFNNSFFNKQHISTLLLQHPNLRFHYPYTKVLSSFHTLYSFLERHPTIFLKDIQGSQGKGIWKIDRAKETYTLFSQKKVFSSLSFKQLQYVLSEVIKLKTIIMQEAIPFIKKDNKMYDFRVLMILSQGYWKLVGIGVRYASHGGFTTHVPRGGEILSIDEVIIRPNETLVEEIGQEIGKTLERHYKVKEFSFDFAFDENHHMWVVDINSKPMTFDEPLIQQKRIELLTDILLFDT
ncbi:YheC/YheD family protein [Evansella sp. AB-rgal1]|uniref:YheC/YheD family protein n=1 Tax=Evansella sp. AB-rgal1 TaxID=3242696 RepID=UPI00359DD4C2